MGKAAVIGGAEPIIIDGLSGVVGTDVRKLLWVTLGDLVVSGDGRDGTV